MKTFAILLTLFIHFGALCQGKREIISVYTCQNIYIQNPFADDLNHYCIDSIELNGKLYTKDVEKSSIAIKLDSLYIPLGSPIKITLYYKVTCMPKILTPMHPRGSKLTFNSIQLNKDGVLTWKTTNDSIGIRPPFLIEQFRFNRWIRISEIEQTWKSENTYSTRVNLLPGINTFRINSYSGYISDTITIDSEIKPIPYSIDSINKKITFADSVSFELQRNDKFSIRFDNGRNTMIDFSMYEPGKYILFYDNEVIYLTISRKKILKRKVNILELSN